MSILIKGMEMPTEEEISKCIIVRHDGEVWIVDFDNLVDGGFVACFPTNPMRAVPITPHGDLIERKAAYESLLDGMAMTGYQSRALDCINEIYVPTIIPAEEVDNAKLD